jgi:hypothetical protein
MVPDIILGNVDDHSGPYKGILIWHTELQAVMPVQQYYHDSEVKVINAPEVTFVPTS